MTQAVPVNGRVAILGLAFKKDTNDFRESAALAVCRALLQAGLDVVAYDPRVDAAQFAAELGHPAKFSCAPSVRQALLGAGAPPEPHGAAWLVADGATGEILAQRGIDTPRPMASTTKMMTAYIVCQLAKDDPKILNETITFSTSALPAGVTATFSPASVTTGGTSTLAFTATSTATQAVYAITVTAAAPSNTHTVVVTLTVGNPPAIANGGFEGSLTGWTSGPGRVVERMGAWCGSALGSL